MGAWVVDVFCGSFQYSSRIITCIFDKYNLYAFSVISPLVIVLERHHIKHDRF